MFIDGQAEFGSGQFVTGNFFSALGLSRAVGRDLLPADDTESAAPAVMISHSFWEKRFGGNPGVVGKTIAINHENFSVVGVAPRHFVDLTKRGSVEAPDVFIPLAFEPRLRGKGGSWLHYPQNWWLIVMGRLKPGVTAAQV